jgi:hypothetical protein
VRRTLHRRAARLGVLRRRLLLAGFDEPVLPLNAPDTALAIGESWAYRARSELESAARFTRLSAELASAGAAPEIVEGVARAAEDEQRHARLCAAVAERFGRPGADRHAPARTRVGRAGQSLRDQLLWEVVSAFCVGETMNASLLQTMLELTTDPAIRATCRDLLRDEVRHARLGWAHLELEKQLGHGSFLPQVLPAMLAASVEPEFFATAAEPWSDELRSLGEPSPAEKVALFATTLRTVILPGLARLHVDTSAAATWLDAELERAAG